MNSFLVEALAGADGKPSGRYRIRVVRSGLSLNGNYYPDSTLRAAVPLFDGARVFVKGDREHLAGRGRDFRNLIGALSGPAFIEGSAPDTGEIRAVLTMLEPGGPDDAKLAEAVARGLTGLFGFSIDAKGAIQRASANGRPILRATKFTEVKSVDLIVAPGAGGQVVGLCEAKGQSMDDIIVTEATAADIVKASGLAGASATRLMAKFRAADDKSEATLRESIADAKAFGAAAATGAVQMDDFPRIAAGETQQTKGEAMLDAFFDPTSKDHKHARSIRECYRELTGDRFVSGRVGDCDLALMRETLGDGFFRESLISTSWSNALGNSITRRMIEMYRLPDYFSMWNRIAKVTNAVDFRTQERWRAGGYGSVPVVAEGGAYLPLSSPTDEKSSYAVTKKGGTEDVTLEMIKNDDVGAIQSIPTKMAMAAKRTLSEFVFDFVRNNGVIYDALAWFHATHGNLSASALDAASYAAARLLMLKQVEKDSAKRLGIPPATLVVPLDLQEVAFNLFQRATENDKKFIATITPDIIPVWYWTDTTDWALFADPMVAPALEIGFLDGNEEPELFVQDNPTVGSMFSNDKLTFKLRHIYGGAVVDFRPAVKSVQ